MLRRILAAAALLATAFTPAVAGADHEESAWAKGSTIIVEDRSGNQILRDHIKTSVNAWNAVGADFTLVYQDGPTNNNCGSFVIGKISWCIVSEREGYDAMTTRHPWLSDTITAANVIIEEDSINGTFGPMHENGHALGLNHSCLKSVMHHPQAPCTYNSALRTQVPSEHDREALLNLYGPKASQSVTVAGSTWFSDGTRNKTAARNSSITARASGAVSNVPYQLVTGQGTSTQPCTSNVVPVNSATVYASNGLIGNVTGPAPSTPGTYQLCFRSTGSSQVTVTAPVTLVVS